MKKVMFFSIGLLYIVNAWAGGEKVGEKAKVDAAFQKAMKASEQTVKALLQATRSTTTTDITVPKKLSAENVTNIQNKIKQQTGQTVATQSIWACLAQVAQSNREVIFTLMEQESADKTHLKFLDTEHSNNLIFYTAQAKACLPTAGQVIITKTHK